MMNEYVAAPILIGVWSIAIGFLPPRDYKSTLCWILGIINITIGVVNIFIF